MTTDRLRSLVPPTSPSRRRFAGLVGGTGVLLLSGCGGGGGGDSAALAPGIVTQPQSLSVAAGGSVTLSVEATGADLQFQWFRNATPISGATTSSLQVVASEADNGAHYAVRVRNAAGEARSVDAVLTVTTALEPGISLVAGGIGGPGYLLGRGKQARLTRPGSLALGKAGAVYFECDGFGIFKATADGNLLFLARFPSDIGNIFRESILACDSKGVLHVGVGISVGGPGAIYRLQEDGVSPRWELVAGSDQLRGFVDGVGISARIGSPTHLVFDKSDNLYFIDQENSAIRKLAPSGEVTTLAGRPNQPVGDGVGAAAGFAQLQAMTLRPDGNLVVIDNNLWRKVSPAGVVSSVAGAPRKSIGSFCVGGDGSLFAAEGRTIVRVEESGATTLIAGGGSETLGTEDAAGAGANFGFYLSLVAAPDGDLIVTDRDNNVLRRVSVSTGQVTVWLGAAAQLGPATGYVDGQQGANARFGSSPAKIIGARLCQDASRNIYVSADRNYKVTPAGFVNTIPVSFNVEAVDARGNLYGTKYNGGAIYRWSPNGGETLWAGQPGVVGFADGVAGSAGFAVPTRMAFDSEGNLLVVDMPAQRFAGLLAPSIKVYGSTLRKIAPDQTVTTIWGTPGVIYQPNAIVDARPDLSLDPFSGGVLSIELDDSGQIAMLIAPLSTQEVILLRISGENQQRISIPLAGYITAGAFRPDRTVFLAVQNGRPPTVGPAIYKWSWGTRVLERVAGQSGEFSLGVRLGALPGDLAQVLAMVAQGDNTLICFSENALLSVQLP